MWAVKNTAKTQLSWASVSLDPAFRVMKIINENVSKMDYNG
jgi:hypothetical protein